MIKALEQAIEKVKKLPKERQQYAAEVLEQIAEAGAELAEQDAYRLSPDERAAIEASKAEVRRGEFATDAEVEAAYARFRK
jgi:DNA-binding protein H-NS